MARMPKAAALLFAVLGSCVSEHESSLVFGETMGTTWQLTLPVDADGAAAFRVVQAELDLVEELMSPWRPESDLSRFARADVGVAVQVAPETLEVLELAGEVWAASGGAFDPTVGALVEASGFGVAEEPADFAVREAAEGVIGLDLIAVDPGERTLSKARAGLSLDLSAVAKGYAVDRAGAALVTSGFEDFLLEVGGEVLCRGESGDKGHWVVGVEAPNLLRARALTALRIKDMAVATSGDYRNKREIDGELRAHIFNAKTGAPVQSELTSVTIVARECATADAYATAAMAMGYEGAWELVLGTPGVEAVFVSRSQETGALEQRWSEGALALKLR